MREAENRTVEGLALAGHAASRKSRIAPLDVPFFSEIRGGAPAPVGRRSTGRHPRSDCEGAGCAVIARRVIAEPRPADGVDARQGTSGSPCRLGLGLCAGMAVRGRRQLGHAALGAPPVPGGRTAGAAAAGLGLLGPGLRLVPGAPRSAQGTQAVVRLRRLPSRAGGRPGMADAAHHRRGGHDRSARARDPATRARGNRCATRSRRCRVTTRPALSRW